jgi:hypothetical protein
MHTENQTKNRNPSPFSKANRVVSLRREEWFSCRLLQDLNDQKMAVAPQRCNNEQQSQIEVVPDRSVENSKKKP